GEGFLDRVQRAGADVAEDDAEGREGEGRLGGLSRAISLQGGASYRCAAGKANSSFSLRGSPGSVSATGAGTCGARVRSIRPKAMVSTTTAAPAAIHGQRRAGRRFFRATVSCW